MVFFTADTHWRHGGARGLYRRPFPTTAAMDEAMIANWNGTVGPDDEVWHLGDVAVGAKPGEVAAILARLHGTKHLVRGNNDDDTVTSLNAWSSVHDLIRATVDGQRVVLCHYALRSWPDQTRGALQLHGHSHGRLTSLPRQFDVGVDARAFCPVRLDQLVAARRARG